MFCILVFLCIITCLIQATPRHTQTRSVFLCDQKHDCYNLLWCFEWNPSVSLKFAPQIWWTWWTWWTVDLGDTSAPEDSQADRKQHEMTLDDARCSSLLFFRLLFHFGFDRAFSRWGCFMMEVRESKPRLQLKVHPHVSFSTCAPPCFPLSRHYTPTFNILESISDQHRISTTHWIWCIVIFTVCESCRSEL